MSTNRYAPHETYMQNVVRGSDYHRQSRIPWQLRLLFHVLATLFLFIGFFGALMIIAGAFE